MQIRLTVNICATTARAIAHQWGYRRRATRSEIEVWMNGHLTAILDDVVNEYLAHKRERASQQRKKAGDVTPSP